MITRRPADARGHGQHGWLESRHTFSFADYYDPNQMGFRVLRVMNEDRVLPGQGFGTHGHRDMEIVSYVLEGELAHRDNLGNGSVLRPGEFQRMTAGTGIQHSEFNPSTTDAAHFYQIWLLPKSKGLSPSYEQKMFPIDQRQGRLQIVASPDGRDGSLTIQQDAEIFLSVLNEDQQVEHPLQSGRYAWLQVLRGSATVNDRTLQTGDGAAIKDEESLKISTHESAELLLFDLP